MLNTSKKTAGNNNACDSIADGAQIALFTRPMYTGDGRMLTAE